MKKRWLFLLILAFYGCKREQKNDEGEEPLSIVEDVNSVYNNEEVQEIPSGEIRFDPGNEIYPDGKYSANIDYFNSETGTSNSYLLDVEIRNAKLVKIEFDNGGWLDDSHFSPERIRNGHAEIIDDRGREFNVKLRRFKH